LVDHDHHLGSHVSRDYDDVDSDDDHEFDDDHDHHLGSHLFTDEMYVYDDSNNNYDDDDEYEEYDDVDNDDGNDGINTYGDRNKNVTRMCP